ncbi:MAG: helix-turn-helix domain-containing protein [Pseudomonadota bacterium]
MARMQTRDQTPLSRMLFVPPPALRHLVRYFHYEHGAGGPVLLPASPHPMLTFFLAGGSVVERPDGTCVHFQQPFANGPITSAFPATWLPGTSFITAVCESGTFGELLGLDILDLRAMPLPLALIAPHLRLGALADALERSTTGSEAVALLSEWLLQLASQREQRLLDAFQMSGQLLLMPSQSIAAKLGLSVRQIERRHLAAYGLSMRERRKMLRYAHALGLMIGHAGQRGALTGIAAMAGYFDQAHMIRDFNTFMGLAPGALSGLSPAPGADDQMRLLRYNRAEAAIITRA